MDSIEDAEVSIPLGPVSLLGSLSLVEDSIGLVVFVHGSGSGRFSPRNRAVAKAFNRFGLGALLFDLLTPEEEILDARTAGLRFDINLLADRLVGVTDWLGKQSSTAALPLGYFGSSTGGGAALVAAARRSERVGAVVSRGGRPDLAGESLRSVKAPTLLIVGGDDQPVIELNEAAQAQMTCETRMEIVPGGDHLFSGPGQIEQVAELAGAWLCRHLPEPRNGMA
jgi:putative phosphoribosyl transferase